jgi:hypothetical protein
MEWLQLLQHWRFIVAERRYAFASDEDLLLKQWNGKHDDMMHSQNHDSWVV